MKRNVLSWTAIVLSGAALVSSRPFARPMPAAPQISPEGQKQARALGDAFNAVAEFVKPSVVQISVSRNAAPRMMRGRVPNNGRGNAPTPRGLEDLLRGLPDFQMEPQQFGGSTPAMQGTGSGFVYDDMGHIVTNNHVVADADKIEVEFSDGEKAIAKVIGTDPKSDVAVIQVEDTKHRALLKGKSATARVGDWVLAIGSPFGFDQTVTSGIISAVGRNHTGILGADAYEDFLQTDAAINPGNSGGPLVDLDGRVIGINSAIATSSRSNSGVGFAIPIDMAANLADQLIKNGKVTRAQLGINLTATTPRLAQNFGFDPKLKGVVIGGVVAGSPADKAGLKDGDLITGFNGTPATSVESFRNLVATSEVGKSFPLVLIRDGKEQSVAVTLASADSVAALMGDTDEAQPRRNTNKRETPKEATELADFGFEVQDLTGPMARRLGLKADATGVVITDVKEDSPADAAGLEAGMVISKLLVNKKLTPVASAQEFVKQAGNGDELLLQIQLGGGRTGLISVSKGTGK